VLVIVEDRTQPARERPSDGEQGGHVVAYAIIGSAELVGQDAARAELAGHGDPRVTQSHFVGLCSETAQVAPALGYVPVFIVICQ
jgi:hypothetical protein